MHSLENWGISIQIEKDNIGFGSTGLESDVMYLS